MNIPNLLTLFRILLIPAIVVVFYLPWELGRITASGIFILAAVTDWLDGYLARNLNQSTALGAFLDPVADKLMITTALILIVGELHTIYITIPAAIIVGREIMISALREWMAEVGKRASMAVSYVAKIKTATQMVAVILLLLYTPPEKLIFKVMGISLLYLAVGLTLWSMMIYLKTAWSTLTLTKKR